MTKERPEHWKFSCLMVSVIRLFAEKRLIKCLERVLKFWRSHWGKCKRAAQKADVEHGGPARFGLVGLISPGLVAEKTDRNLVPRLIPRWVGRQKNGISSASLLSIPTLTEYPMSLFSWAHLQDKETYRFGHMEVLGMQRGIMKKPRVQMLTPSHVVSCLTLIQSYRITLNTCFIICKRIVNVK